MSMKAIKDIILRLRGLTQAARVTGGSPYNATGGDFSNAIENKIDFEIEAWTDGTHALKLQDSPDNSAWTDVVAADQVGTLTSVTGTGGQQMTQQVSYIGNKRYARGVITSSGTTTGCVIGISYQVRRRKQP